MHPAPTLPEHGQDSVIDERNMRGRGRLSQKAAYVPSWDSPVFQGRTSGHSDN